MYRKYHVIEFVDGNKCYVREGASEKRGLSTKEGMYLVVEKVEFGDTWVVIKYHDEAEARWPVSQVANVLTNRLEADLA